MTIFIQPYRQEVRDLRQGLIARLLDAGATSPQSALEIPADALSSDQRSLLADFVRRGIVEEFREKYYLNTDAYARSERSGVRRLYVGLVLLAGIIAAMLWFSRGLK
jgi:hypothetical protein